MDDYYKAIGLEREDWERVPELDNADAAASLAYCLDWVLYCAECKGKGTVYNPSGRDLECDCRTLARRELSRYKDGQ